MSDAQAIERAASEWAVRRPLSAPEAAELEAWLAADPRHPGALLRAEAAWRLLDDAAEAERADETEDRDGTSVPSNPRRRRIGLGLLAGAVAGVAAMFAVQTSDERMITRTGEIRRVPLADGSVTLIDSHSELLVDLRPEERRLTLTRGEAWFDVERDEKRPFLVDAGIAQVQVLGTEFAVERSGNTVRVSVTEGTVATWSTATPGAPQILKAGQFAVFSPSSAQPQVGTAPEEVERRLAWRAGEIALDGETLGEAVERFNEYNRQKLVVEDTALRNQRLVGLFRIGDPEGFAETAAELLGAEVEQAEGTTRIRQKKLLSR